jgi:predicted TIM-barrel fold metal-dependent hydrolase
MATAANARGYYIIDVHAHPYVVGGKPPVMKYSLSTKKYYEPRWKGKSGNATMDDLLAELPTVDFMVQDIVKNGVKSTPVAWDAETSTGEPPCSNDFVATIVRENPDAFLAGWGSVDPWKGQKALEEAVRCIKELKLIGFKFQQASQRFHVNDKQFYPLWDLCQEIGAPVQFHCGYTGLGSGAPGGDGIYCMSYCRPIEIDEVAADFPHLKIIMLHAAEPWPWEANMVALHKKNVVRETSGIWPRYFPETMMHEMNRRLQDKFLFGSEWGYYNLEQVLADWAKLDLRPGVIEKVMYKNAIRFLGEDFERVGADLSPWKDNLDEV